MTKETQHVFAFSGLQVAELVGAVCGQIEVCIREVNRAKGEERAAWIRHIERGTILLDTLRSAIGGEITGDVAERIEGITSRADATTSQGEK